MLYLELDFNTHIGITTTVRNVKAKVFGMLGVTAKVRGMVRVLGKDVIKLPSSHVGCGR